jgi:hypothetical protein
MWLFSAATDDHEHVTAMKNLRAVVLNSTVKHSMHAIQKDCKDGQLDALYRMIQSAKTAMIWRWSGIRIAHG